MFDKRMLPHKVTIEPIIGLDEFQAPIYGSPIEFDYVRFDFGKQYRGLGENRELFAEGVVFFYAQYTTNFGKIKIDWLNARLTFQGKEYLVKDITPGVHWLAERWWSVEMDVI